MEVVTHFVNDTVEFYKWSLTIAGESSLLLDQVTTFSTIQGVNVHLFYSCHQILHTNETNIFFASSRQESGELANDVFSYPHTGHQLPVPVLLMGGA